MPNPLDELIEYYEEAFYGQELTLGSGSTFVGPDLSERELAQPIFPAQPEHILNYDKLTAYEQKIMDALPGLEDSWLVNAAESVSGWPVLKQLLDAALVMSSFAEKVIGTTYLLKFDPELQEFGLGGKYGVVGSFFDAIQVTALGLGAKNWMDDPVSKAKFESAWEASALFYEAIAPTNFTVALTIPIEAIGGIISGVLAGFDPDKTAVGIAQEKFFGVDHVDGWVERITEEWEHWGNVLSGDAVTTELGGLSQLIAMRQELFSGANPEEVRNNYFGSLGALALRSQLFDGIGQAVIDPLFFVLPKIRIVDRLRFFRHEFAVSRVAPLITDALNSTKKIIKTADGITDKTRVLNKLVDIAKQSDLDEFIRLVDVAKEAVEGGEDIAKAFAGLDDYVKSFDHLKDMNRFERVLISVTGGDPMNPPKVVKALGEFPVVGKVAGVLVKAVTLTPKSRATEFVEGVLTSVRMIMKTGDDPMNWIKNATQGMMGIFGTEFGHAFVSPVGRHVQSVMKAWVAKGSNAASAWKGLEIERILLERMAKLTGTDIVQLINRLHDGGLKEAETVLRQLNELVATGKLNPALLGDDIARLNATILTTAAEVFRQTPKRIVPYTSDMFKMAYLMEIADSAHDLAILQFGVEAEGFLKKMINPIKAAESLVLLGLNPNYPIQNLFNNEITGIARGLSNTLKKKDILRIWDDFDFRSGRLGEAFTIAGEAGPQVAKGADAGALAKAMELNQELLRNIERGETGIFDKITDMINKLPDIGMRTLAREAEAWQGDRFLTQGLVKAWKQMAPHIIPQYDEVLHGLGGRIEQSLGTEIARVLRENMTDARKIQDIDDLQYLNRMQLNIETITRRAAENLGLDADRVQFFLGDEISEATRLTLKDLNKPDVTLLDVDNAFDKIGSDIQKGLDAALVDHIPVRIDEVAAKIAAEGPAGVLDIHGQVVEDIFNRQVAHSKRLDEGWELINSVTDPNLRNAMVKALFAETDAAWARTWDFSEAAIKGIEKGLAQNGMKLPDEFVGGIKGIRNTSENYIKLRNTEWGKFFDDVLTGNFKTKVAEDAAKAAVYTKLDAEYTKLITNQDDIWRMMDEMFLGMFDDPELVPLAAAWRGALRDMRRVDMQELQSFRQSIRGLSRSEISQRWIEFGKVRLKTQSNIQAMETMGKNMFSGDQKAINSFREMVGQNQAGMVNEAAKIQAETLSRLAEEGIELKLLSDLPDEMLDRLSLFDLSDEMKSKITFRKAQLSKHGVDVPDDVVGNIKLADLTDDSMRKIKLSSLTEKQLAKIGVEGLSESAISSALDVGQEVLASRRLAMGLAEDGSRIARQTVGDTAKPTIANLDPMVERNLYQSVGIDELWYQHQSALVQEMRMVAREALTEPAMNLQGLDPDLLADLNKWFNISKGELNDARHVAVRMAEGYRDSAMLNYRRSYGIDVGVAYVAPFAFWTMHSVVRWAISSLDHSAMLVSWAKARTFLDTVIGDRQNLPKRLRGRIKIELPFLPPEFGSAYIDPLRAFGLPFEQFLQPFEMTHDATATLGGRIDNKLQEWISEGIITEEQYNTAIGDQESNLYTRAKNEVLSDDQSLETSALDFMNLSVGLHLPFQYAWRYAQGREEEIGPLPHTRTIKNIAGLLGIDPGYYDNTFGNVRRAAGLPGFDEWEPYRIDRELSNMVAENLITVADMQEAMYDNARRVAGEEVNNPNLDEAWRRTNKAQGFSTFYRLLGIPLQPYPIGEEKLINLYDDFYAAVRLRDSTGSSEPVTAFFDEHPEFEARLALWDEPEERLNKFLVDQLWDRYHDLSSIDRRMAREQLGEDFINGFLDRDTANPTELDPNILAAWLKQLGGDAPGTLGDTAIPIEFAPPEISDVIEQFYNVRNFYFPDFYKLQSDYYDLPEKGSDRSKFRDANPQLVAYWEWRRGFLKDNPATVPYLSDSFEPNYASKQEQETAEATQPNYGIKEVQLAMLNIGGAPLVELANLVAVGGAISEVTREAFIEVAASMGITLTELLDILRGSSILQ